MCGIRSRLLSLGRDHRFSTADLVVACLWLLLALLSLPSLILLSRAYLENQDYSHGFLVPLGALMLMRQRWREGRAAGDSFRTAGAALLLMGIGLILMGQWYDTALRPGYLGHVFVRGTGVWFALSGMIWIFLGWRATLVLAPALAFLLFAIPLPGALTKPFTAWLQQLVSVVSTSVLRGFGVQVYREGNILHLMNKTLGVAEACSGVRSMMVLLALAVGVGLYLRLRRHRITLLVVISPLAAVVGNVLRVTISGMLCAHGRPEFLDGRLHDALGFLTVLVSGGLLLIVAAIMVRLESRDSARSNEAPLRELMNGRNLSRVKPRTGLLCVAAGMLIAGVLLAWTINQHYRVPLPADNHSDHSWPPLAEFPLQIGEYACTQNHLLTDNEVGILKPSDHTVRWYRGPNDEELMCTIIYWAPGLDSALWPGHSRPGKPHSPDGCYPGAGWEREARFDEDVSFEWLTVPQAHIRLYRKPLESRAVLFWRRACPLQYKQPSPFRGGGVVSRLELLFSSWNRPLARTVNGRSSVLISVRVTASPEAARRTAIDFAEQVAFLLPEYGID